MDYKTFKFDIKSVNEEEFVIEGFAAVYNVLDEQGDIIEPGAFSRTLDHKGGKFPLLWQHDPEQPLGVATVTDMPGKGLWVRGELNREVSKAREALALAKQGAVKGFSIGYNTVKADLDRNNVRHLKEINLWEVSHVTFPANPQAQVLIAKSEVRKMETKGAIPYKKTPLADENAEWDAGAEVAKAEVEDLKVMCAWYDEENPDIKSSYKLPHHKAEGHACVWRAVAAAMAALFGARGGVDIPDSDRKAVYNHLARHYEDFGKEPPDFKTMDLVFQTKEQIEQELKYGRILSTASRSKVEAALQALKELLEFVDAQEAALRSEEDSSKSVEKDSEDLDSFLSLCADIRKKLMEE